MPRARRSVRTALSAKWRTSTPSARSQKNRIRRRGIYLLPNLFTTAALFAGFYAIVQAIELRFGVRSWRSSSAMELDGLDGRVACASRPDTPERIRRRVRQPVGHGELRRGAGADRHEWALKGMGKLGWIAAFHLRGAERRCGLHPLQRDARRRRQALVRRPSQPGGRRPGRGLRLHHRTTTSSTRKVDVRGWPGASRCSPASPW